MFILGVQASESTVATGRFDCPYCHDQESYRRVARHRWFYVLSVPLVPTGREGDLVECQGCFSRLSASVLDRPPEDEPMVFDAEIVEDPSSNAEGHPFSFSDTPSQPSGSSSSRGYDDGIPVGQETGGMYAADAEYASPTGFGSAAMVTSTPPLAITSLVLAIMSPILIFFCGVSLVTSLVAIITGHVALSQIKQSHGAFDGRGMALAGVITGYFSMILTVVVLAVIIYPAFQEGFREAQAGRARRSTVTSRPYTAPTSTLPRPIQATPPSYKPPSFKSPSVTPPVIAPPKRTDPFASGVIDPISGDAMDDANRNHRAQIEEIHTDMQEWQAKVTRQMKEAIGEPPRMPVGPSLRTGPRFEPPDFSAADPSRIARGEIGMPGLGRPELGRPELGRPNLGRPELGIPDQAKPEIARPGNRRRGFGEGGFGAGGFVPPPVSPPTTTTRPSAATRPSASVARRPSATPSTSQANRGSADKAIEGQVQSFPSIRSSVKSLAFSHDGRWLAAGTLDRRVLILDVETGELLSELERIDDLGQVMQVAFAANDQTVLASGYSGAVVSWPISAQGELGEMTLLASHDRQVDCMALSGQSPFALTESAGELMWQTYQGAVLQSRRLKAFDRKGVAVFLPVRGLTAMATDGRELLSVDLKNAEIVARHDLSRSYPHAADFSVSGERLAISRGYEIEVIDTETGQRIHNLKHDNEVQWTVRFLPDGTRLVSGGRGKVTIWDVEQGRVQTQIDFGTIMYIQCLAVSADGTRLAGVPNSSGQTIRVIRLPDPDVAR